MIESEPRGFGRRAERVVPELQVHHQHQPQPQEQNAQAQAQDQQQVRQLDIGSDNSGESNSVAPAREPAPTTAEEDARVIRVSETTTNTVSETASGATPASSDNRNNTNITTTNPNNNMGLAYNVYLNSGKIYGCRNCKTHLANHEDIISRNFRGQHGKAYLFNSVVNVETGDPNERNMTTGRHVVRDIHCRQCKEVVGWKYDRAYEPNEKYKEGKFILEAELLANVN
ncbi:hypothetical protein GE21DRAFT_4293 [Neurospora crassa]|uniref:Yippee zinc-binding protein n=1 Tax=Neurospora crassa (strain ATCC 24698 / 74-OR23-1A / CBS 708.71 / DSM 1257 / FGSC 987) TaxID=367110 RepID=U9W2Y6_NEUCR|nr:yippee zinc-binding protein [Neurospora crassa OR74A]XP_011393724.1 yippee zinc-binding protein, variant [Neurospora crassa OR74A]ESA43231.1 yippee zinc-binding protein [Neurospora crassa OR74A]ESA43232.1 yippee zinc-binding protein, variant [Neurospora crassa OR74A]KHE84256.1 hypothetical protein GE21DRAFT_4293 [Neurospora crassa]|eukprot:XP_011393723.1 yippee zinc-binding protein [Neurospora crassa OR74A]